MSKIFWDTNLFVYLIEDDAELSGRVIQLRERMLSRKDVLLTSTLTLGEILLKAFEKQDAALALQYESALAQGATIAPFDLAAARRFSKIRVDRDIRVPDAIQLACAAEAGADLFITNDDRLSTKNIEGIQFITSLDRAFL